VKSKRKIAGTGEGGSKKKPRVQTVEESPRAVNQRAAEDTGRVLLKLVIYSRGKCRERKIPT